MKYVAVSEYRRALQTSITRDLLASADAREAPASVPELHPPVRLLRSDPDALLRVVHALLYETAGVDAYALGDQVAAASDEQLARVLRTALDGRGRFDPPPRALETTRFTFEITTDFGAYRDLQRHRMLSPFPQRLGTTLGFDEPAELAEMGVAEEYRSAMERAEDAWRAIAPSHPYEAQVRGAAGLPRARALGHEPPGGCSTWWSCAAPSRATPATAASPRRSTAPRWTCSPGSKAWFASIWRSIRWLVPEWLVPEGLVPAL